jgi:hypothetical protein
MNPRHRQASPRLLQTVSSKSICVRDGWDVRKKSEKVMARETAWTHLAYPATMHDRSWVQLRRQMVQ